MRNVHPGRLEGSRPMGLAVGRLAELVKLRALQASFVAAATSLLTLGATPVLAQPDSAPRDSVPPPLLSRRHRRHPLARARAGARDASQSRGPARPRPARRRAGRRTTRAPRRGTAAVAPPGRRATRSLSHAQPLRRRRAPRHRGEVPLVGRLRADGTHRRRRIRHGDIRGERPDRRGHGGDERRLLLHSHNRRCSRPAMDHPTARPLVVPCLRRGRARSRPLPRRATSLTV